ncbi:MAG: helix-turn-helix domain-containing protein [Lachnospiraceae bacterium]|nr:helix-turn-helix domain-containing protein [Lachnospiraceae bacterium]
MSIGERIHFFRDLRGLTLNELGLAVGFPKDNANIRIAQYQSGSRMPREDVISRMADALDVSPAALKVPDIDSYTGLMHTLFTLEDLYGLKVSETEDGVCLRVDVRQGKEAAELHRMLCAWKQEETKLETGEITKEEYDCWRYHYPGQDTSQIRAAVRHRN